MCSFVTPFGGEVRGRPLSQLSGPIPTRTDGEILMEEMHSIMAQLLRMFGFGGAKRHKFERVGYEMN